MNIVYKDKYIHKYNKKLNRDIYIYDCDDYLKLTLTRGEYTIFDEKYLNLILEHKWRCASGRNRYAVTGKEKPLFMHNLICNCEEYEIDHKNRDGLDNRAVNLRIATRQQQMFNRSFKSKKVGDCVYHGVVKRSDRDLYRSWARDFYGTRISLGHFNDPITAAIAWDEWMFEKYKNHNPLLGFSCNGFTGEPTLNFINFNFPERLDLELS